MIGVDLGVKTLATLSDGTEIIGPKPYIKLLQRLRRLSKSLSRKQKNSRNAKKAKQKLANLHARIKNIRLDNLHKLTTYLVLNNIKIAIEDLNVRGMVKNRRLSKHIMEPTVNQRQRKPPHQLTNP